LTHHAVQAERWDRVVRHARCAGLKFRPGRGDREAVQYLEQALSALSHLPDDDAHRALGVDLRDELARVLVPAGEHPRMVAILREAEAISQGLGDDARLARTLALLCVAHWEIGDSCASLEAGGGAAAPAARAAGGAARP